MKRLLLLLPVLCFDATEASRPDAEIHFNNMTVELGKGVLLAIHLGRIKDAEGVRPEQVSLGKLNNVREALAIALEGLQQLFSAILDLSRMDSGALRPELRYVPIAPLVARLDTLQDMRQSESNRLAVAHGAVEPSVHEVIATLDKAIADVKSKIRQTIDDDPDLRQRDALLQTIPGLGERTIPQLLAYIGRPERFRNVKALIAYASLSPMIRQSGTSLDKRRGTHPQGHRQLKHALYFPAMVAGKYNPAIAAFWQRLKAQNKPGKVIVVACMHKLLAIIYGVLKSNTPFDATRFSTNPP